MIADFPWVAPFLAALSDMPNVTGACRAANVTRARAYALKASDPAFASAWGEAIESAVDGLVADVWERARGPAGSDKLAMFLLQAHRRAIYGQKVEQQTDGTLVIEVRHADPLGAESLDLPIEQLQAMAVTQNALSGP